MGLWSRIVRTFRSEDNEAEIREELAFHLHMDVGDGHDGRQARLRLGNLTRIEEETRAMGIVEWLDSVLQDARFGLRQFPKTPGVVLAVVLSLAVGIGSNTAIFSLVDAAILRPLPVHDPASLRIIEWTSDGFPNGVSNINGEFKRLSGNRSRGSSVGAYLYRQLVREQRTFEALMGVADPDPVALGIAEVPAEQVSLQYVSSNFFQGLGVTPVIGRAFLPAEDQVGQEPVVVVSHRLWVSKFGSGREALDSSVRINNVSARIIGVAPPRFFGLRAGQWTDVYAPLAAKVAFAQTKPGRGPRGEDDSDWWVRQMGRLKPGVPETAARSEMDRLFQRLAAPGDAGSGDAKAFQLITLPGLCGFNALPPKDAKALWILMLLVGLLLLMVCANVANLLLSRSVGRQRESAVRLALGATRGRLFRQHLIESGVLAVLGGAAGLALGYVLAQSLHLLFQSGRDASSAFDLHLDVRVLGYTGALSILTAFLFGLAPAGQASRANLNDTLKTHARVARRGRLSLPRILVSTQIALCLTALVAAGLLGRTLTNLKQIDVGFDRENLAYASVNPVRTGYSVERMESYAEQMRGKLARLPGVLRVSTANFRPLSGMGNNGLLHFPGRALNEADRANLNAVGEGFFETLRIPLVAGRALDRRDLRSKAQAVVVDEVFARRFFPGQNPLRQRFGLGPKDNNQYEIAGVVGNSRYNSLRDDAYPTVYEPYRPGGTIHFAIRSTMDSGHLSETVRKALAAVDPAVSLTEFHRQTELIDRMLRTERLLSFVSGAFGVVAVTLAAIGLGGLLAYAVARRTNEIGVRMALGASARDITWTVMLDSLQMVGTGILIGIPCAYAIGKLLKTTLFRLEALDPWITLLSLCALLTVAFISAWVPAFRAMQISPLAALRQE